MPPYRLFMLVLWASIATSFGEDFYQVIRNPRAFHGKQVTLVAMADVGGDRFYLYQPPKPKSPGDDSRVIYGELLREGPIYDRFDHKWVQVTGIIDAEYRGLASGNACGLIIQRVRPVGKIQTSETKCSGRSCLETHFVQLLKQPETYEHKCLCVVGFAHVVGDAFVIYESEKAAAKPDFAKGIFISQKFDGPNYNRYDKRWIKIMGIIDMSQRGFADYPCGMIVERVEPALPRNTAKEPKRRG
jgi:hypothetical protein